MSLEPIIGAKRRRVLSDIPSHPTPNQLWQALAESPGWNYKVNAEHNQIRDRALVAVLYLAALRISEALRLTKAQFQINESFNRWEIIGVKLSKVKKDRPRVHTYRQEIWLPMNGERAKFTELIVRHLDQVGTSDRLFPFKNRRALQIVGALTTMWNHYFRALGEKYLYRQWGNDLLAVADYIKVDPATLSKYITESYRDKPSV